MSNDTIYKYFADYIKQNLGIIYEPSNYYQLEKRLKEICSNLDIETIPKLYDYAVASGISGHFKQLLLDIATNNETSFFRDPNVFNAFRDEVLPQWHKAHPSNTLFRIWSVACSFGQEPYSLAIILKEYRERNPTFPRVDIRASDISEKALSKAKSGLYSQLEVQRGMPALQLVKYFKKTDQDMWQIDSELRSMVSFSKMNLLDVQGMQGTFDLVLCRNVLIYQNDEKKKEILKNLTRYVANQGLLLLGAAESLLGLSDEYQQEKVGRVMFYRKK